MSGTESALTLCLILNAPDCNNVCVVYILIEIESLTGSIQGVDKEDERNR